MNSAPKKIGGYRSNSRPFPASNLFYPLIFWILSLPFSACAFAHSINLGATILLHAGSRLQTIETSLKEIKAMGFSHVAFHTYEFQRDTRSVVIQPIPEKSAPLQVLRKALDQAHDLHLNVILSPVLLLDKPRADEWRGNIHPTDFNVWKKSYTDLIKKYARISQEHHVETLVLGSELSSIESQPLFWQALIASTRQIFQGKLTYSFNWDHLSQSLVWKNLDFLSISSYFELSKKGEAVPQELTLVERWKPIQTKIESWAKGLHQKVLFLEVGYPNHDRAFQTPWDYEHQGIGNPQLQWLGIKTCLNVWQASPVTQGLIIYTWDSDLDKTNGYAIKGKPAETFLRQWINLRTLH